jgi:hypothetical protein
MKPAGNSVIGPPQGNRIAALVELGRPSGWRPFAIIRILT